MRSGGEKKKLINYCKWFVAMKGQRAAWFLKIDAAGCHMSYFNLLDS